MSVETSPVTPEAQPPILMSAGKYMAYLWLGHCIYYPGDYREEALQFHESASEADIDMQQLQRRIERSREMILIEQLRGVVKSARTEAEIRVPLTETERYRLKIYLIGEVAVKGKEFAEATGLFEDYPDLAEVRTPLADYRLVDGVMRYQSSGKVSTQLSHYATMERLLPGYPPAISEK